jgi:hypothetical protein
MRRSDRIVLGLCAVAGVALVLIGLRFLLWPEIAAKFFGVGARPAGTELHAVVGFRDLWLGALALVFAGWRDWRALALWCATGAMVCFADAALVWAATAKPHAVAFHTISGLACAAMSATCWRRHQRPPSL